MATDIDPTGVMARAVLESADFAEARVLEVGAGDGRLTFQYAGTPRFVVGLDSRQAEIQAASKRQAAELRRNLHFFCASATALPFTDEHFGIVLLASVL